MKGRIKSAEQAVNGMQGYHIKKESAPPYLLFRLQMISRKIGQKIPAVFYYICDYKSRPASKAHFGWIVLILFQIISTKTMTPGKSLTSNWRKKTLLIPCDSPTGLARIDNHRKSFLFRYALSPGYQECLLSKFAWPRFAEQTSLLI